MIHEAGSAPTSPTLPPFVTHEPEGIEKQYILTLHALTRDFKDEMSVCQGWIDKDLVRAIPVCSIMSHDT